MTTLFKTSFLMALAASTTLGARAADVDDLANQYAGQMHHNSNSSAENSEFAFSIDSRSADGKFTGNLGPGLTMNGKVSSAGKMTFTITGSQNNTAIKITKGKGQLSATGRFIVGSLQLKVTPPVSELPNGAYTFSVENDELLAPVRSSLVGR